MDIKRTDEKLIKDIEEWNKQEKCTISDGRTELEKTELEKQQEEIIKGQQEELNKLRIENNLMRELLSRPISYTYGIR